LDLTIKTGSNKNRQYEIQFSNKNRKYEIQFKKIFIN